MRLLNCDKCGHFVGKRGFVGVVYDDWNGGHEVYEALCGRCYSRKACMNLLRDTLLKNRASQPAAPGREGETT